MGVTELVEQPQLNDEARASRLGSSAFKDGHSMQPAKHIIAHGRAVLAEPSHRATGGAIGRFAVVKVKVEFAGAGMLKKNSELCAKNGHGLGR